MSVLLKVIYKFNVIPTKIPMVVCFYFSEIEKSVMELMWQSQDPTESKNELEKQQSWKPHTS
jgi:hypothetical protein